MFPESFVRKHLEEHTQPGDCILDPFSGRGTTVLEALLTGRHVIGLDINPVAYCLSAAKAQVPDLIPVLNQIDAIERNYARASRLRLEHERRKLPAFFRRAFYHSTLDQLLYLRRTLDWKEDPITRFICALALGSLHGEAHKSPFYFSNRMPRTISPKPNYALKYWGEHGLWPKKRDVFSILRQRARFRLGGPTPTILGNIVLSDVRDAPTTLREFRVRADAVITSPPYFNVTNYEEDQWLRLWFLGYAPKPTYKVISKDDRHLKESDYWRFLREAWNGIAPLLKPKAIIVCRLGAKGMGAKKLSDGLTDSLSTAFPYARELSRPRVSKIRNRQTDSFRPGSRGCVYEIDYVFRLG